MNSKTVCVIGAMDSEITGLKALLNSIEEIKQGTFTFFKGNFFDKTIVVAKCGIGKVCAAVCAQMLIDKFKPDFIINTGVAGGLDSALKIGDVVIAEKLVQHDFDVRALGYAKGNVCTGVNPDKPTFFHSDEKLISKFQECKNNLKSINFHQGIIASGDEFIASKEKKQEIKELFNAKAVEMEGASIAYCAELNNIPFIVIRSISDLADEKAGEGYKFNEKTSAEYSALAIKYVLENI